MALLVELPVAVRILKCDGIAHAERHELLVEYEETILSQLLELAQRNALRLRSLDHFLDGVGSVLRRPPLNEVFGVIRIVTDRDDVVLAFRYELLKIIVDLVHVESDAIEHHERSLLEELVVFESSRRC